MTRYRRFTSDVQDRRPIAPFLALLFLANAGWAQAHVVLDAKRHHLGIAGRSEWDEFAGDEPEGPALKLSFEGRSNPREATLLIRQHNVKLDWPVRLNGRPIGHLLPMEAALWHALPVPPGTLRDGANTLLIESPGQIDDVVIDQVALDARPVREALGRATLDVSVTDAGTGAPLPCRITITDPAGILAPLVVEPDSRLAARPGVVYTPHGRARIGLPPGKATVFGSRGFEYGVASRSLTLEEGQSHSLDLVIRREVSTPGLVACAPTSTH